MPREIRWDTQIVMPPTALAAISSWRVENSLQPFDLVTELSFGFVGTDNGVFFADFVIDGHVKAGINICTYLTHCYLEGTNQWQQ